MNIIAIDSKYEPFLRTLPDIFDKQGTLIHEGRNTLKTIDFNGETLVVKRFGQLRLWQRIIYTFFRGSKAKRSYKYALRLQEKGIGTPHPKGYVETTEHGLLADAYYVCSYAEQYHTFKELILPSDIADRKQLLWAIGDFTGRLHNEGIRHKDYSAGNILFHDNSRTQPYRQFSLQLVDLNRLHFGHVTTHAGLRNFERLNIDREALTVMAHAYALRRGLDPDCCAKYIIRHRWHKHVKNATTNL